MVWRVGLVQFWSFGTSQEFCPEDRAHTGGSSEIFGNLSRRMVDRNGGIFEDSGSCKQSISRDALASRRVGNAYRKPRASAAADMY